jgi:hypothetical protein
MQLAAVAAAIAGRLAGPAGRAGIGPALGPPAAERVLGTRALKGKHQRTDLGRTSDESCNVAFGLVVLLAHVWDLVVKDEDLATQVAFECGCGSNPAISPRGFEASNARASGADLLSLASKARRPTTTLLPV